MTPSHRRIVLFLSLYIFLGVCIPRSAAMDPPVLNGDDRYVLLDMARVANTSGPAVIGVDEGSTVRRIPFQLRTGEGPNQLFMQPIGWSAAENEGRAEYGGYMAKYDYFPAVDDPTRAAFEIPLADYQAIWLLAASDDDPALSTTLTVRLGRFGGRDRTAYHDFSVEVPRAGMDAREAKRMANVTWVMPQETGNLYLMRVPIERVVAQDFRDHFVMHMDLTRELKVAVNLPDANRYQMRPLGDPSGVRIHALTLERASMQMTVSASQPGGVYNLPEKPRYDIALRNHYTRSPGMRFEAIATRDDGEIFTSVGEPFDTTRGQNRRASLTLDLPEPGHYEVAVRLLDSKDRVQMERHTTLAMLAPDTRQHRESSPWGTWDFAGSHNTLADDDIAGPLSVKAGLRYVRDLPQYGLLDYRDPQIHYKGLANLKKQAAEPDFTPPPRGLIFHETSVSGPHVLRTPDVFTGRTYTLTENDQKRFDLLWQQAMESYEYVTATFPDMEVYFGNGMPQMIEEFCRHNISKDYLKIAGNESGHFMRLPEAQPTDPVANNAGLFMFRTILDHYGYQDTKLYQCFETSYPCSSPGNLSERTQANHLLRNMLHSYAWRIPLIRMATLTDMGNSYYHSNWGAAGLCHAYPDATPKPAYVAVAVMTQALDGATFSRQVPTGSNVVYAFEAKRADGQVVTALWTTRGSRALAIQLAEPAKARLVATYGRESVPTATAAGLSVTVGEGPVYLLSAAPITAIVPGAATYEPPPEGEHTEIASLASLDDWTINAERDYELESYNFLNPRRQGQFTYAVAPELDGRESVVTVEPKLPVAGGTEYLQMYSSLSLKTPKELPGVPTEIGLWVHSQGSWGRVVFELEDASGQRWISLGAEMSGEPNPWMADWLPPEEFAKLSNGGKAGISDWNTDDVWGKSVLNHDGWRYISFPLPGQYGQQQTIYHWPYTGQWRFTGGAGDGKVHYPLTFKRLVVTLPEKVLVGTDWRDVLQRRIALSGLQVTYRPADEAFATR